MRFTERKRGLLVLAVAAGLAAGHSQAIGQAAPGKDAAKDKGGAAAADAKQVKAAALEAAQKAYVAGTKSFESGKHKEALAQLSMALAGGGLPSQQMAKALYYRGVANRKLGKPAQAMSDLTTAIWVNGGLSDADRAQAIENRQAAYREAGLGDQPPADVPVAAAASPRKAATATPEPAAPAAQPVPVQTPAPAAPSVTTAWAPAAVTTAEAAVPAPAVSAAPPSAADASSSGIPSPYTEPATTIRAAPTPAAEPAPALAALPPDASAPAEAAPAGPNMFEKAGKGIADAGSNVGNFFASMFKGGGATAQPAPTTDAASLPSAGPDQQTSSSPVLTAAAPDGVAESDWGGSTSVSTTAQGRKVAALEAAPGGSAVSTGAIPAAETRASPPPASGKYILQIAAVRSRAEAEELAGRVKAQHQAALGGREPLVDEAVIGNFGSFHRVRVGPYADQREPGKFCSTLIKTGFDCLVVTQ
ncbi:MAG: SPOR domain-containing protein [Hyphomicrobium sp.]